tara:strand:+ start:183 stop:755 length:573 start_codon:yes stop_codon:yes gene_type:complete
MLARLDDLDKALSTAGAEGARKSVAKSATTECPFAEMNTIMLNANNIRVLAWDCKTTLRILVRRQELHNGRPVWNAPYSPLSLCWTPWKNQSIQKDVGDIWGFWAMANLTALTSDGQASEVVLHMPLQPFDDPCRPSDLPPFATRSMMPPLGPWGPIADAQGAPGSVLKLPGSPDHYLMWDTPPPFGKQI